MTEFKKAERKQVKLKLAITGPSGSGKTFSALLIAFGIGKKVALVDTENQSASLYADMKGGPLAGLDFDSLNIDPPYTIAKYLASIEAAEKAGYDVLVIDSITHAWAGEGGLLSKKESLDQRGGNQYTNWASITKEHEQFKARLLSSNIHIICTMRSKQDYILEQNDKGKATPKKVGLAPVQRDGIEYEFATVFDMAMDHNAVASKDRTSLWDGVIFKPTVETGKRFVEWLASGKPASAPAPAAPPATEQPAVMNTTPITGAQASDIMGLVERLQVLTGETDERISEAIKDRIRKVHHVEIAGVKDLTEEMAATLIASLNHWIEAREKKQAAKGGGQTLDA